LHEATFACTHPFKWEHVPGKHASLEDYMNSRPTTLRRKPRSFMNLDGAKRRGGDPLVQRTTPQTGARPGEQAPEGMIWMPEGISKTVKR
jgi:hypothetical protein